VFTRATDVGHRYGRSVHYVRYLWRGVTRSFCGRSILLEDHMGSISTIISLIELYQLLSQFS
jgi:hypothetical protein